MASKLPGPVGATRQRLLDRAQGRRQLGGPTVVPGAHGQIFRERIMPALLATLGLGIIAWVAFGIPFLTLIPPLLGVASVLILIVLRIGRR